MKLTKTRLLVLRHLAADHVEWLLVTEFYSAPSEKSMPSLRRSRFSRRLRSLPYRATFVPLVTAGLIEEREDQFKRRVVRITAAGREALAKATGAAS